MTRRNAFLVLIFANVYACQSAPTTKQTAETISDAAQTQSKIGRAAELAADIKTATTPQAKEQATARYVAASQTALASSGETIENLKKFFIDSENARGTLAQKLNACQIDASVWGWVKWLLVFGGPFVIAGAFILGRKFA